MNWKSLLYLAVIVFAFQGAWAHAQSALQCQPGSGTWRDVSQNSVLDGALCALPEGDESDFYRINFDTQTGQFAPAIPGHKGPVRYLFGSPKLMFYADDATVYALENDHYKVVWHRPWAKAQLMPIDGFDAGHFAVWSKTDKGSQIHLVRFGAQLEEEMSADLGSEAPIDVVWQAERLIVLEKNAFHFWTRPGIPAENASENPTPQVPASWNVQPTTVPVTLDLAPENYRIDMNGILLFNRNEKKLSYYRFLAQSWTTARINATAAIQGIGTGTMYSMGVTIDANTVRIVARLGGFLQNRFEAKYWRLPTSTDNAVAIGQDNIAALDGGSDNRVQTIDTTEVTWKRLALIEYPTPGRIAELKNDVLMTIHNTGNDTIILWNARTGQKIGSLPAAKLKAISFDSIKSAQSIEGMPRYKLITNAYDLFIIFDSVTGELTAPQPVEKMMWSTLPRSIEFLPNAVAVQTTGEKSASEWNVFPADKNKPASHRSLSGYDIDKFEELQTPAEKWYGYCLSPEDCFLPSKVAPQQKRETPEIAVADPATFHKPTVLSWLITILSFFAMFGVMLWRHGFGRKSLLKVDNNDQDFLTPTDIFDDKNRRYVSDRDNRLFLAPNFLTTPWFRVLISILAGLGVGIFVAVPYYFDDSPLTFLSWVVVLGMPVTAIVWIASSWQYWNRYYLLRFGCMTEGKWLNTAQTNPSIIYEPQPNKTYELSKRQWQKVDFVPMVLFDPARPSFALQYTGGCTHTLFPTGKLEATPSPACTFDICRLGIVIGLLAVATISTQLLFQVAYPNPLSAWGLERIASNVPENQTFATLCLQECSSSDKACHSQCHQRQLRLVLQEAGIELPFDPTMTTSEFLDKYRAEVAKTRSILYEQPELGCAERESQIAAINLWPQAISDAFWRTYSNVETFKAAGLGDIYMGLKKDADMLKQLCDSEGVCAQSGSDCSVPPTCPGTITSLKARVCAFQNALNIPDIAL